MTLTISVLSWKSPLTLSNTLESYKYYGLDRFAAQKVIFFQDISKEDTNIAESFGYDAIGAPDNIGIAAAYKQLVDYTTSDIFLFLENDWLLIEKPTSIIMDAKSLLELDLVDVVKLRHAKNPGAPLWSKQYAGKEMTAEGSRYLLDSIHWTDPANFDPIACLGAWRIAPARYANWTNNPTMFRTDWLRSTIVPRLTGDIERALQPWWESQDGIKIAQHTQGLFTHLRIDR